MYNLEIAWLMVITNNVPEVAAWANKIGNCVIITEETSDDNIDKLVYTTAAVATCSEYVEILDD